MINLPGSVFVIEPIASKDEAKASVQKMVDDYQSGGHNIESSIFTDTHPQSIQKLIKREYIDTIDRSGQEGKITVVVSPYIKKYPAGDMKTLNLPDNITTMDIKVAEPILDYHPFSLTVDNERNEVIVKDLFTGETAGCPREMRPELDGFTALGRTPNIAERILLMKLTGKYIKTIEADERTIVREPFTPLKNIEGEIWYYPFWEVPIIEKREVDLGIIEVRKKRPGHKILKETIKLTTSFENAGAIIYDGITAAEIKKTNIHSYFDRDDKSNLDVKIESTPLEESEKTSRLWLFTKMLIIGIILLSGIVAVITAIRHGTIQARYKTLVNRGQYEDLRREISRRGIKLSKSMIQDAFKQLLAEHDIDSIEKLSNAVRIKPQLPYADVQREYNFFAKGLNIQGISKLAKISKHPPGETILKPVYEILSTKNDFGNFLELLRNTRIPPVPDNVHHFYDILFKESRFEDARMLSEESGIPPLDSKVQSIYTTLFKRNDLANFIKLLGINLKPPNPETVHRYYDVLFAENRFDDVKMLADATGILPLESKAEFMYEELISLGKHEDVRQWKSKYENFHQDISKLPYSEVQEKYRLLAKNLNIQGIIELTTISGHPPEENILKPVYNTLSEKEDFTNFLELLRVTRVPPAPENVHHFYDLLFKANKFDDAKMLSDASGTPPLESKVQTVYNTLSTRHDLTNFIKLLRTRLLPTKQETVHHFYDVLFAENRFDDAKMLFDASGIPPLVSKVQIVYSTLSRRNDLTNLMKLLRTKLISPEPETVHHFYDLLFADNRFDEVKMLSDAAGIPPLESKVQSMFRSLLSQGRYKDVRKWMDTINRSPEKSMVKNIYENLLNKENYNKIQEIKNILRIKPYYEVELKKVSEVRLNIKIGQDSNIISGNRLYCNSRGYNNRIIALDIANPHSPRITVRSEIPARVIYMACDKDLLYFTYFGFGTTRKGGLRIFRDVGNSFKDIGYINIDMSEMVREGSGIININRGYAYINYGYRDLVTLNITNPESPKIVHSISLPNGKGGGIISMKLHGNHIYYLSGRSGLGWVEGEYIGVINVSNPISPEKYRGIYPSKKTYLEKIVILKDVLYILGRYKYEYSDGYSTKEFYNGRVIAFDISNPNSIRKIDSFELPIQENYENLRTNITSFNEMLFVIKNSRYYIIGLTKRGLKLFYEGKSDFINVEKMLIYQGYVYISGDYSIKIYQIK